MGENNNEEVVHIEKKSWTDFRMDGLLRFVNMFLHIFGWTIIIEANDNGDSFAYPARVTYDGFCENEETAFFRLGKFMAEDEFFKKNNERRASEYRRIK